MIFIIDCIFALFCGFFKASMVCPSTSATDIKLRSSSMALGGKYDEFLLSWNVSEFVVFWNVPSHMCAKYGIQFDGLAKYGIVYNDRPNTFIGNNITIFYKIGKFPQILKNGSYFNGGMPQLANLKEHEEKVRADIEHYLPDEDFKGLGVIDWEEWRPDWDQDWRPFDVYRNQSIAIVRQQHPTWNASQTLKEARMQFESAAQKFMYSALAIAREMRPKGFWGYYGFPPCYNYGPKQKYCSPKIMADNDEGSWMFASSSALYPSIYIRENSEKMAELAVLLFGRLAEAQRIGRKFRLPILPYSILYYSDSFNYFNETSILATVGQAAALGLPGVVLWASSSQMNTNEKCRQLHQFLDRTLGPAVQLIKDVTKSRKQWLTFPDDLDPDQWLPRILSYYSV